jgi:G3E family GTPase
MTASPAAKTKSKARYIMIGGFLGAGKTTAVGKLARKLTDEGLRVGLITNDQGRNLVDTTMLRAQGFATEEIPGGCFCCRFNSLVDAAQKLTASTRPDVFIAEPVGSCTDLAATVTYPLRRIYKDDFTVAPISVLVDPIRAQRVFGLQTGGSFSEKVIYIYKKQIEEADLVVISKSDLLDETQLNDLRTAINLQFPDKRIIAVSARDEKNLDEWFSQITDATQSAKTAMEVDYEVYAEGEALLGWLNCTVQLSATDAFDPNDFLKETASEIQKRLAAEQAEVAHMKMTLSPDESLSGEIAGINLVRNDVVPELSYELESSVKSAQLIINVRAEAAPNILSDAVREGLAAATKTFATLKSTIDHLEHFRPGKPTPTHRIEQLSA